MKRLQAAAAASLLIACGIVRADTVELRGEQTALEGEVTKVDEAGVAIRNAAGVELFRRWDQVRQVRSALSEDAVKKYQADADALWRARTRLERGDAALAAPLFERLFEKYRGHTHATALVVAEGLLRCRLARGENEAAVVPALEAARLRAKGLKAYEGLSPVIDEATSLCTGLPPAWASTSALIKLERDLDAYDAQSEPVIVSLQAQWLRAARLQLKMDPGPAPKPLVADHPGVKILEQLAQAISADAAARTQARARIEKDLAAQPAWIQAWDRYFIGESLLMESGMSPQQEGLVSLVNLPATFADAQPYLTGLALSDIAAWFDRSGDGATASMLRNELQSRYPVHPALLASAPARSSAASRPAATSPSAERAPATRPASGSSASSKPLQPGKESSS